MKAFTKKIVLENGREFYGYGFGADREAINEIATTVWPTRITRPKRRPSAA